MGNHTRCISQHAKSIWYMYENIVPGNSKPMWNSLPVVFPFLKVLLFSEIDSVYIAINTTNFGSPICLIFELKFTLVEQFSNCSPLLILTRPTGIMMKCHEDSNPLCVF